VTVVQAVVCWLSRRFTRRDLALVPILGVAAWERLAHLEWTDFGMDEAGVYHIAQDALVRHAIPVTSVLASIGYFNQALPVYFYLPFVLLRDPIFGTLATALANIVLVDMTYGLARRYLGYPAAVVSALLLAVAAWPVFDSRQIWPPDLVAPALTAMVLVIASGVARGRAGWLPWALVLWNVAIQFHPAALALVGLLVVGWALAPRTVRWRDVLLGAAITVAFFVPTVMWEVGSNFIDLRVLRTYSHGGAVINLEAVKMYLRLANIPDWVPWRGTPLFALTHALVQVLVGGAALYGMVSVIVPAVRGWRAAAPRRGPPSPMASVRSAFAWVRAPGQAGWRIRLLVVLWPALVLISQLRHYSAIQPHYLLPALPTQFLLVGLLAQDAFVALRAWGAAAGRPQQLPWRRTASALALGLPLAALCVAHLTAAPAQYPSLIAFPIGPEKAGLTLARQIVRRDHVTLVEFQPDFFSREAVRYLLENGYSPGVPAQIVEPDRCLPLPARTDARTLYLFSGPKAFSEGVLRALSGVRDLFAGGPAAAYFRAYEVTPDQLFASLPAVASTTDSAPATVFGGQIGLQRLVSVPAEASGAPRMAALVSFVAPQASAQFATIYVITLGVQGPEGWTSGQTACVADRWFVGERALLIPASVPLPPIVASVGPPHARVSMSQYTYDFPEVHLGPLPLESAYVMANMHFFAPAPPLVPLPAACLARPTDCADGTLTLTLAPNGA
jgi:hypothetical protein